MKILLDCDTGIDDALAIFYLAKAACSLVAVGTVHGNVDVHQAARNTRHILSLAGLEAPVAVGSPAPLAQATRFSPSVHGEDGLAGRGPAESQGETFDGNAVEQMIRLARALPGELTLLATGPLTNLARAVEAAPDIANAFRQVVIMGGAITAPGNAGIVGEANIIHDPEAAEIVFQRYSRVTLVGLDVTTTVQLDDSHIAMLSGSTSSTARFAAGILEHYVNFYRSVGHSGCALHDPLAAMLAMDPNLAEYAYWPISVELEGRHTRGMTVAERRPLKIKASDRPLVRVARRVEVETAIERMMRSLC